MSCTDSSTTSSDTSDPGSPYSPASLDDINNSQPMAPLSTTVVGSKTDPMIQSSIVSSSSKLDFTKLKNSGSNAGSMPARQQWHWNNNVLPKLVQTLSNNNHNNAGIKYAASNVKKGPSPPASLSLTPISQTSITQSVKSPPMLVEEQVVTPPQTKITGFFNQMKPTSAIPQLTQGGGVMTNPAFAKKDLTNLVIRSKTFPDKQLKEKRAPKEKQPKIRSKQGKGLMAKKPVTIAPRVMPQQQAQPQQQTQISIGPMPVTNLKPKPPPTMVLAAIRINNSGSQQNNNQTGSLASGDQPQPVPQSTTTPTKMNTAMFQYPINSNFVQIPNLLNTVSSTTTSNSSGKTTTTTATNILMSSCQLAQIGQGMSPQAAQYILNGAALLKLSPPQSQQNQSGAGLVEHRQGQQRITGHKSSPPGLVPTGPSVPFVTSKTFMQNHHQNGQNQQNHQNHQNHQSHHHQSSSTGPQQMFMTATSQGILLNANAIPAMLALDQNNRHQQNYNQMFQQQMPSTGQQSINRSTCYQYQSHTSSSPPGLIFTNQMAPKLVPTSSILAPGSKMRQPPQLSQRPVPAISLIRSNVDLKAVKPMTQPNLPIIPKNLDKLITPVTIKTEIPALSPSRIELLDKDTSTKSPTIPMVSPEEPKAKIIDLKSPKSLVLERMKSTSSNTSMDSFTEEISIEISEQMTESKLFDALKEMDLPKQMEECAKSPILSQPKTIRFPATNSEGYRAGMRKSDGRVVGTCYWDQCDAKYDTSSKLLDHLQTQHVNPQTGPFSCVWSGCRVRGRESCSRRWLEGHVLSHGGTKTFKCIFDGCGQRFGSQVRFV